MIIGYSVHTPWAVQQNLHHHPLTNDIIYDLCWFWRFLSSWPELPESSIKFFKTTFVILRASVYMIPVWKSTFLNLLLFQLLWYIVIMFWQQIKLFNEVTVIFCVWHSVFRPFGLVASQRSLCLYVPVFFKTLLFVLSSESIENIFCIQRFLCYSEEQKLLIVMLVSIIFQNCLKNPAPSPIFLFILSKTGHSKSLPDSLKQLWSLSCHKRWAIY